MVMPQVSYWSAAAVRALPFDGKRYETVHGELLVTPAPAGFHQPLVTRLMLAIGGYLQAGGVEGMLTSPADIIYGEDTLVQPDLLVCDPEEFFRSGNWEDVKVLHLAIEILSPSSLRADRFTKRRVYQEQHVPTYWVVDPDNRQVEVWTPEAIFPRVEGESLTWRHPEIEAECRIDLAMLFAR